MADSQSGKITENTGEGRGSGHKGPARGFAFGVASVTQALQGASFPISKDDLIREYGDEEIHLTKDSADRLAEILEEVDQDEFLSIADIASAVSKAHGSERG
jgi:hypothetical protein